MRPDFALTLETIERNLTASLIATADPLSFEASDSASDALSRMRELDFSQALVSNVGSAAGVLIDTGEFVTDAKVGDVCGPLEDWMLVSRSCDLRAVLHGLAEDGKRFRLVVGSNGIEGIVTRSDIHKLPVRMFLFSLVTHLEFLLTRIIKEQLTESEWLRILREGFVPKNSPKNVEDALSGKIGPRVEGQLKWFQSKNEKRGVAPDLIDTTDFGHKWYIVGVKHQLDRDYRSNMAAIQKYIRNRVMHQLDYVIDDKAIKELVRRIRYLELWIARLTELLEKPVKLA